MKNKLANTCLGVFLVIISAMSAGGQEAKPEAAPAAKAEGKPEAKPVTSLDDIKNLLGMSLYFQGGYTYNFEKPDSGINRQRIFDQKANTFLIDMAQVQFAKDAPEGGLGFKLKVSAGETAKYIHSAGLGNPNDEFDLTEAYVDYVAPLGSGLKLRFGKFATYHSAEVIEARDNFNYSRSFLFNYAVPFTHTGFMAQYALSKEFSASLYLVNGWDVTTDNNNGKSVGASFGFTPAEILSFTFNFMYGPEQANNSSHNRFLFDWVGAIKPSKELTFMANIDYAREDSDPNNGGNNSEWYGAAVYAKYEFADFFSASIRAEYFDDQNGVRTGIAQKLKEITLSPEFKIAKNLLVRPEYRHDWSDQKGFDSHKNAFDKKSQDTIAFGMMYTW
ncbi:MAG TPA: porin [Thermodesulfobacteriota bacterium]|nr:porin [Thermodesulfobacteriota bacterium]